MRLKILSIVPFPLLPAQSGGQKKTVGFLNALGNYADLTVVSTKNTSDNTSGNFQYIKLLAPGFYRYFNFFSLKPLKKIGKEFDFLMLDQPFMGLLGVWLSSLLNKRLIIHSHNIEYQRFKTIGKWWWKMLFHYEKWVFSKADFVIFISEIEKQFAITKLRVNPEKCLVATYGTQKKDIPQVSASFKNEFKNQIGVKEDEKVFLFFGVLDYAPNREGLDYILEEINPYLSRHANFNYSIIICGRGLTEKYQRLENNQLEHMKYMGFVDNIDDFIAISDIVLNPILTGGGVKTKVVEALAMNKMVVSTESGAEGVFQEVCGGKLKVTQDRDWPAFSQAIIQGLNENSDIPSGFYQYYNMDNIAKRITRFFEENLSKQN
ncbi:glycosyltransferase family 4 protein [Flexithrix dorotheae]|uniref:glycosyltransferase family 4 protein n=1 Tax=Flexithrix dorotheae TaxID=70993 RepID=UPI0003A2CE9F|nr:glycosyltransferase family 4 protein [Flexithrix dorotheae]